MGVTRLRGSWGTGVKPFSEKSGSCSEVAAVNVLQIFRPGNTVDREQEKRGAGVLSTPDKQHIKQKNTLKLNHAHRELNSCGNRRASIRKIITNPPQKV